MLHLTFSQACEQQDSLKQPHHDHHQYKKHYNNDSFLHVTEYPLHIPSSWIKMSGPLRRHWIPEVGIYRGPSKKKRMCHFKDDLK